ncbi:MAG: FtsX-like permease family protein [Luteitalea sp.]|nr:FtsX-like permease family protein [Luteitalea sp.]
MTSWGRKLRGWCRRRSIEAELREEMQAHLDMKAEETCDPDGARRQFGNTTLLLEEARDAWGWPQVEAWLRDFRYGLRMMRRRPGFAATVVLTLALGIGSSSTIFSLIDTVLIRPLAYPSPDSLVALHEKKPSDDRARTPVAPGRLEDWQRLATSFEALAGSTTDTLTDTTGPVPERISGAFVSPRFFTVLGVTPIAGRVFNAEEEQFGGPAVVVVSEGFWRRRFGADPRVLGRSLMLAEGSFTIVGVMPAAVQHPSAATEIWVPGKTPPDLLEVREARFYNAVGRLKEGVTLEQAHADLAAVQRTLGEQYPKTDAGWSVGIRPLKEELVGEVRLALWLLLGSVGLLLLIACANIACLLLVQLNGRRAEIATRHAIGASHAAIARQLLAEGLVYSLAGGLLGLVAAFAGVELLRKRLPDVPRISELAVNTRMLAFVLGVSVLAAVLFSLAPVLQTFRHNLAGSVIRSGKGAVSRSQRLPRILVGAQLALATVLLVGAGLFLRTLMSLQEAPLGFRPDSVLTLRISFSSSFAEPPDAAVPRHPERRAIAAGLLRAAVDGSAARHVGPRPIPHAPGDHLFGDGAGARRRGTLRRHGIHGDRADQGDWHPRGDGSAPRPDPLRDLAIRRATDRRRVASRDRACSGGIETRRYSPVRCPCLRRPDVSGCGRRVDRGGARCLPDSRSACHDHRSDTSAPGAVARSVKI